jgi:alpha-N-arabinofuranosidase
MKLNKSTRVFGVLIISLLYPQILFSQDTVRVSIDVGQTKPPINEYLFGQFIEHMGRTINDGLWAEKLRDRKFYYGVGNILSDTSFWKISGNINSLKNTTSFPYAGEFTPSFTLSQDQSAGIYQDSIDVIKNSNYTGRIVLSGSITDGAVLVSLIWGEGSGDRQSIKIENLTKDYKKYPLEFKAGATTDNARLEITGQGAGVFRIGTVSLMPCDNIDGFHRGIIENMKRLNATIYRWPGGNFASGYHWKDGIGDRDKRPPRWERAWGALESNDMGVHEFMDLCSILNTEPSITVNTGEGEAPEAVEWLQYMNGATDTPMGQLRKQNGRTAPWGIKYWYIGNEMFGRWQLGYMGLEPYIIKHRHFVESMKYEDPSIKCIAVGQVGEWNKRMIEENKDVMDLISLHYYAPMSDDVPTHVWSLANEIKAGGEDIRAYQETYPQYKDNFLIALDEWNYSMFEGRRKYPFGFLGPNAYLKDGLGTAAGYHQLFRDNDVYEMATWSITVNVFGAMNSVKTEVAMAPPGLASELYRNHYGTIPVQVRDIPNGLNIVAAWKDSTKQILTIAVVNPNNTGYFLEPNMTAGTLIPDHVWWITGPHALAQNWPGQEPSIVISNKPLYKNDKLEILPLSATIFMLRDTMVVSVRPNSGNQNK